MEKDKKRRRKGEKLKKRRKSEKKGNRKL